jgi:hypothetical protein
MPLSGYTSTMPNELLENPALIYIGSTPLGATKGGISWDPEMKMGDIKFDGSRGPVKGLQRIESRGGKVSGSLLQIASLAQTLNLEPGGVTATSTATGITSTLTPKGAGILFTTGDYLVDFRAMWETGQGPGHYFSIYIPVAYCMKYSIKGGAIDEAEVPFDFQDVLDMSVGGAKITDPAWHYEYRTGLPA